MFGRAVRGTGLPLQQEAVQLPKLQVDALLSPVGCEIELRPIIRGVLDLRDQAQMLGHAQDAEIEICERPPRPVALDLKAKPTGKPSESLWRYLTLIAKVGRCFKMAVILHGSGPGRKKEPEVCKEKELAL